MNKVRLFVITVITLLLASNVCLGVLYTLSRLESNQAQSQLKSQENHEKAIFFAKLFIEKVLLGEGTVDFEDRLRLENAVRDINDQKIFNEWQTFTKSESDKETQSSAGELLEMLFDKVS